MPTIASAITIVAILLPRMACPFFKTAPLARNIRLLSKNAGRRITLGVRWNKMPSYSGAKRLSINPDFLNQGIPRPVRLWPGCFQYRVSIMQLNIGQIT
jgi:hypothetical protein